MILVMNTGTKNYYFMSQSYRFFMLIKYT